MKRLFYVVLTVCFVLFTGFAQPLTANADTASISSRLPTRNVEDITAMWQKWMEPTTDYNKPYVTDPSTTNPYTTGSLQEDYIQDGVNAANFYRYISGLPYDLTATDQLNQTAQYGSVLLSAEDKFSHTPPQPKDMPFDFYRLGYNATSSANIYGSLGAKSHIVLDSIHAYMDDSDIYNLDHLGHRRWILNPPLKLIGIGQADSKTGWSYSSMQIFDWSRAEPVSYDYVPFPAAGAFPTEVFHSNTPWSVSLNMDLFKEPVMDDVHVAIKRIPDGKTWSLDKRNNTVSEQGAYFTVENNMYGSGPAIIFRPDGIKDYIDGQQYEVTITGLATKQGTEATLDYTVSFFSIQKYLVNPTPFPDLDNHWARTAVKWALDNHITAGYQNGTFQPDRTITEEEFLKMFLSTFYMNAPQAAAGKQWSNPLYAYATAHKLQLPGDTDSTLRAKPVTRLSIAELITSATSQALKGDAAIQYLLDNGYSQGKTSASVDGYAGKDTLTRGEAVQFLNNLAYAKFFEQIEH